MTKILGVDPGGMNGLAWFGDDYKFDNFAQISLEDLPIWLQKHEPQPDLIILENYRLWKHRAVQQAGSSLPAAQAIGMVKSYAKIRGIEIIEQSPQVLQNAEKMSGIKMKGLAHNKTHWIAAHNHVYWYLVQQGLVKVYIPEEDRL